MRLVWTSQYAPTTYGESSAAKGDKQRRQTAEQAAETISGDKVAGTKSRRQNSGGPSRLAVTSAAAGAITQPISPAESILALLC